MEFVSAHYYALIKYQDCYGDKNSGKHDSDSVNSVNQLHPLGRVNDKMKQIFNDREQISIQMSELSSENNVLKSRSVSRNAKHEVHGNSLFLRVGQNRDNIRKQRDVYLIK